MGSFLKSVKTLIYNVIGGAKVPYRSLHCTEAATDLLQNMYYVDSGWNEVTALGGEIFGGGVDWSIVGRLPDVVQLYWSAYSNGNSGERVNCDLVPTSEIGTIVKLARPSTTLDFSVIAGALGCHVSLSSTGTRQAKTTGYIRLVMIWLA